MAQKENISEAWQGQARRGKARPGRGAGREGWAGEATVAEHRARNPHVGAGATRESFVETREARDATLALPDRMLFALQVNLRGGRLPEPGPDGHRRYLIPADRF